MHSNLLKLEVVKSFICKNPKDVFLFFLFPAMGFSSLDPSGSGMVLEYYKSSLKFISWMLFLKYEEMKREPAVCVKKLVQFLG